jgi:hypothetical protein
MKVITETHCMLYLNLFKLSTNIHVDSDDFLSRFSNKYCLFFDLSLVRRGECNFSPTLLLGSCSHQFLFYYDKVSLWKSKNKQYLLENLERKSSLSTCIFVLNLNKFRYNMQWVSVITFISYTGSRKIGEPNDFKVLQNFIVVYSLECKCYIYLRYASFPLISIWKNTVLRK